MALTERDILHDISVVICAYTELRWSELLAAVESVLGGSLAPREVILVVDHNPALLQRARAHLPGITIVENHQARGLSGARNSGIQAALGSVIAFLDEDAIAAPDWLARLVAPYADETVLGVGGAIEPLWAERRPDWFPAEFDWVVGCTYRGMPAMVTPVRNLIGCNMSFRREALLGCAGFHTGIGRVGDYPAGCEETEFCIRLQQRRPQHVLLYEPRARVQHRVPAARARWSYFSSRCYAEGLSKASVSRLVGAADGLASERAYTTQTLPQGVLRGLGDALLRGRPGGLLRAGAIVAGLGITAAGYARGVWRESMASKRGLGAPEWVGEDQGS